MAALEPHVQKSVKFIVTFPSMMYARILLIRSESVTYLRDGQVIIEIMIRIFENRILRQIFGPKRDRMGSREGSIMRNFIVCTVHLI